MAEPVTLQTLLTYLSLISIPIGVFYHIMTVRNSSKNQKLQLETRQIQLFMQIYNHYNEIEFAKHIVGPLFLWDWEDVDEFWELYGPENDVDAYAKWTSVLNFFKGVGVLVQRNQIDISIVYDLLFSMFEPLWEKWEPIIKLHRVRYNVPTAWAATEYLYNELMKYVEEHPELKT